MAAYVKIADWVENMVENADLESDTFKVALSNTNPTAEAPTAPTGDGDGILANVTEVTGGMSAGARTLTKVTSTQTGGTYKFDFNDLVMTATASVGPFRWVYIYDDTVTSPADPLVCYFDYGSSITLLNTETLTITFNASGLFTVA
jgi:hypothetical protein